MGETVDLKPLRTADKDGASPMVLLVSAGTRTVALPLSDIMETLRPLSIEALRTSTPGVVGVSIVRGEPVPVVDLAAVMQAGARGTGGRWVVLKGKPWSIVLAVDQVVGMMRLSPAELRTIPPMLREVHSDLAEAIVMQDSRCVTLLDSSRIADRIPTAPELLAVAS